MTARRSAPRRRRTLGSGWKPSRIRHRSITIILAHDPGRAAAAVHRHPAAVERLQQAERLDRPLRQRRRVHPAGARPERRRRHGRPAGPRLRRLLRHRCLHVRVAARPPSRTSASRSGHAADRGRGRRHLRHPAGCPDTPTARRLPGHRDARIRRDRAGRVPERQRLDQRHHAASSGIRSASRRSADFECSRCTRRTPGPYYVTMAVIITVSP